MTHTPIDPATFWVILSIAVLTFAFIFWRVWRWQSMTQAERIRVEASRLILSYCKKPTPARFDAAWDFIEQHDVMLTELDWELVNRFARTDFRHNAQEGLT